MQGPLIRECNAACGNRDTRGWVQRRRDSRNCALSRITTRTLKVPFSTSEYPTDPSLLAKSLAAKSRECIQYQAGQRQQQQVQQRYDHNVVSPGYHQQQQQPFRTTYSTGSSSSRRDSSQGWFGRVWRSQSSSSSSGQRPLSAAAAAAAAVADAKLVLGSVTASEANGSSSGGGGGYRSPLVQKYSGIRDPKPNNSSSSSSSSSSTAEQQRQQQEQEQQQQEQQQQQQQQLDAAWNAMSVLAATSTSTEVAAAAATATAARSSGSSRSGASSRRSSSSSSSSWDAHDEADWLTEVLSASTSRLSVHSNAVLTNSLRRLASLRTVGGPVSAAAAGPAAAAADETEALAGLLESVRSRFGTFQLQHFEEVALQLAQLGYQPDDDWLESFEWHSRRVMRGSSPRLLSRLLLARAKLSGTCSDSWCAECLRHMTARPERLTVSSWVNALWALVRLKQKPDRQFQTTFFASSAERLDDVSPELLNNLVWSLARLQLPPTYLWWRSLVQAAATIEKSFSHSQLASLIHSVALWAEPGGIAPRDVQVLIDLLLEEVDLQLSVMQPAELTTIVWSLGSLTAAAKLLPDWEIQARLLAAVQSQLPRLNPRQLSSLCWGLAKLDQELPECFAEALFLEVQAQMQGFSDSGLANVMWALAKVGRLPGVAFKQALWEELHHRCHLLHIQDMCTLLWSLARLHMQPPSELLLELLDHALSQLRSCDASQLANLSWALGRLQASPNPSWLTDFEEVSVQTLPSAHLPDLVKLAWGRSELARQRVSDGRFVGNPRPASMTWQAAVLRHMRLRCRCLGHEIDCLQLVQILKEMGIDGLSEGAAAAEASFWAEDAVGDGCPVELFKPGCE